jgi:hypothetical protein
LRGMNPYKKHDSITNQKPMHSGLRRSWKFSKCGMCLIPGT